MRDPLSLLILLAATVGVMALRQPNIDAARAMTAMMVGFMLIGAWLVGRLFKRIGLPQISGYLIFGLIVGPSAWSLIPAEALPTSTQDFFSRVMPLVSAQQTEDLRFVKDLAISLIAITAGGEIQFSWLKGQLKKIAALSLAAVFIAAIIIAAGAYGLHQALPVVWAADESALDLTQTLIAIAFIGLIASGNSPAIAIATITECRADGPLSRTMLAVTVCKDLLIIILFATLVAVGKGLLSESTAISGTFLLAVGAQLGGSLLIGAIAGMVMAWFVTHVVEHLVFFVVGACFLFALLGDQHLTIAGQDVHLEPLLVALAAGMTMENLAPQRSAPLFHTIERMSLPVYCVFFAVAAAELDLRVFTVGAVAATVVLMVVLRAAIIWGVISGAARVLKLEESWRGKLWLCLTPQSGVTLALVTLLSDSFTAAPWIASLRNLILGMVTIHALAGPIAARWALVSAGEAGRADQTQPH